MKISISKVDSTNFIGFVNRLKVIDSFVYFKIKGDTLQASAYLPQRDAVKHHRMPLSQVFQLEEGTNVGEKELKVAFFDASKITDAFKQFEYDAIKAEIEFVENEEDCVATTFKIFNDELEITLACSEPSLGYKDLTDAQIQGIFNTESETFRFDLDYTSLAKVRNLFSLDKEETFSIQANGNGVKITGKTYNMVVTPDYEGKAGTNVTLFKKYLNLLDKEDYSAHVLDNRVVLRSNDSETLLTIATCQTGA
jgi:hypothetical protein|tara:strand:- start:10224 stop:10979 length:756 start_codon:yes stop_codon:yes gene_type:complete